MFEILKPKKEFPALQFFLQNEEAKQKKLIVQNQSFDLYKNLLTERLSILNENLESEVKSADLKEFYLNTEDLNKSIIAIMRNRAI
ncbi:hypothetical protein [Halpernia sp.]|uniref:hypothetical protein n=1 Tax=Halpernia sp. TaxID=2782209 RepID=UPI003A8EF6C6